MSNNEQVNGQSVRRPEGVLKLKETACAKAEVLTFCLEKAEEVDARDGKGADS